MNIFRKFALAAALAGSLTASLAEQAGTWTGKGPDLNWSTATNWFGNAVPSFNARVYFEDFFETGWTNQIGAVNNIVDSNTQIGALYYTATSKANNNHYYTTLINPGVTLQVGPWFGSSQPTLAVGDIPGTSFWTSLGYTNYTQIQGAGTLFVNEPLGQVFVGGSGFASPFGWGSILDMTNLYTFTANVARFYQDVNLDNPNSPAPEGSIFLARTNTITTVADGGTAPGILIGASSGFISVSAANGSTLVLGGQNTFNSDALVVAGNTGQNAAMGFTNFTGPSINGQGGTRFLQNTGSFTLRGSAGGLSRAAIFAIGDQSARPGTMAGGPLNGTSATTSASGSADFRNGTVDIMADRIYLGHGVMDGGVTNRVIASGSGGLIYEQGTIDVNNLYIGYKQGTNGSQAFGYLTLQSNAVMTVNNNLYMAYLPDQTQKYSVGAFADATASNIVADNAVLNIGGNLQHNDGIAFAQTNGASFLSMRGGLINMLNGGVANLWSLEGFGTITNASLIAISNTFSPGIFSPSLQAFGTLNLSTNVQFLGNFPINFDIGSVTNIGSPFNDYVNIQGNVSFNSNAVTLIFGPNPPAVGAPYTLMTYGGSKTGSLVFTNTTRSPMTLDQSQPGKILLNVSSWTPGTVTWNGASNQTWSATAVGNMVNWGQATNQYFLNYDNVRFDDSVVAVGTNLVFTNFCIPLGTIYPGSIYFSNNSSPFYLSNSSPSGLNKICSFNGTFNVTKEGTNMLVWSGGMGTNNYTGNWFINNGVVKIFDSSSTAGPYRLLMGYSDIYLTNNATLDLTNTVLGAGNALYLSGTGFPGYFNPSNAVETDGVLGGRNNGGIGYPWLKARLLGDTTISTWSSGSSSGGIGFQGVTNGTSLISPAGLIPFGRGELSLNGHTLTVHGTNANPFSLVNVDATTAGDMNILAAELRIRSSSITGSGTIHFTNNTPIDFNNSSGFSTISKRIEATNWLVLCETNSTAFIGTNIFTGTIAVDESAPFPTNLPAFRGMLVSNDMAIQFDGPVTGTTELYKMGRGPLLLNGANTYTNNTWINNGTVILGSSAALPSQVITLNPAVNTTVPPTVTTLGLPAGGFTLASGQTLALNGVNPPDVLVNGNLTAASGAVLFGAGTINGALTLAGGSEIAPGGTNNQGQIVVNGNLNLNGAHLTWDVTPSFGTSDGIVVNGDLNLTGVNTFTIDSIGGFSPDGTNTLITYTGSLTGTLANLAVSNPLVRFVLTPVDPTTTLHKIQVVLTVPPANLVWNGADATHPTYWDIKTTTNWLNLGTNDIFASADFVTFDQTAVLSSRTVDVGGAGLSTRPLTPGGMTVSNATYVFRGADGLITSSLLITNAGNVVLTNNGDNLMVGTGTYVSGDSSLSMRQTNNQAFYSDLQGSGSFDKSLGTNTLKLVGSATNWIGGSMSVNAGQLSVGQNDAVNGPVSVASGATLDIGGRAINGATVTAQGVGFDGKGAINNRLFVETNITDWNSNVVKNLILAGDTTLGAISNAWGIQSLTGNAHNLTKTGAQDIWIATGTDTGLGNVTITQGRLFFEGNGTGLGDATKTIYTAANSTLGFAITNYPPGNSGYNSINIPAYSPGFKSLNFGPGSQASPTTLLILSPGGGGINNQTSVYTSPITFTNNLNFIGEGRIYATYLGNISSPANNNGTLILSNNNTTASLNIGLFGTNTYASNTWVQNCFLTISNMNNLPTNSLLILSNANGSAWPNNSESRLYMFGNNMFTNRSLALSVTNAPVMVSGSGQWWGKLYMHGSKSYSATGSRDFPRGFDFMASSGGGLDLAFTNIITTNGVAAPVRFGGNNIRLRASMNLFIGPVFLSSGSVELGAFIQPDPEFPLVPPYFQMQFDSTNNWYLAQFDTGRINWNTNNVLPPGGLLNVMGSGTNCLMDLHGFSQALSMIGDQGGLTQTNAFFNDSTTSDSTLTIGGPSYAVAPGVNANVYTNSTTVTFSASTNTVSHHVLNLAVTGGLTQLLNTNNYDGVTTVTGGKLLLGNYTAPGASGTVYSGMLQGTNTVTVSGTGIFGGNGFVGAPVIVNSGGTILPGECLEKLPVNALPTTPLDAPAVVTRTGPLTFMNTSLTFNAGGTAFFNVDNGQGTNATIVGLSSVAYGGTLVVSNISAVAFTNNQVVKLFDSPSTSYSGSFSSIKVWGATSYDASRLTVDGTIKVLVATATTPVTLARSRPNKNTLILNWPADHIGWRLQIMTNTTASGMLVGGTTNLLQNTNWVNCDGATTFNSTNLTIANTNVVFRLIYP
jgi:hypothetical protein